MEDTVKTYRKIKGTADYYGIEARKRRYTEETAREICRKYNMEEIITPLLENTEVFRRSSGEASDIVIKQMYSFTDRGGRNITIRPEGTAGVVRAFLENKLYVGSGVKKYFYCGPMYRYERPQAGRFREFTQFGVEFFGGDGYLLDATVIAIGDRILRACGLAGHYRIVVNTIGDFASRSAYADVLRNFLSEYSDCLCEDCRHRLERNPLRILDCKICRDLPFISKVPGIENLLTPEAKEYFRKLTETLTLLGCDYDIDPHLVRGLDYYTDTVFEYHDDEGKAIGAGGRYAELVKAFGGPDLPGTGFALGLERVIALLDREGLFPSSLSSKTDFVLIGLDEKAKLHSLGVAERLREKGYVCELDYRNTALKPQFKLADRVRPAYLLIFGEEEVRSGTVTIKNNADGVQRVEALETFLEELKTKGRDK